MDLIKEMEEYKAQLIDQGRDLMERMNRLNVTEQTKGVNLLAEMLGYDYSSLRLRISMIETKLEKLKRMVLEEKEA